MVTYIAQRSLVSNEDYRPMVSATATAMNAFITMICTYQEYLKIEFRLTNFCPFTESSIFFLLGTGIRRKVHKDIYEEVRDCKFGLPDTRNPGYLGLENPARVFQIPNRVFG